MWGVFVIEETKEIHIMPVDREGEVEKPHIFDCFCYCQPKCCGISEEGILIFEHNMEN